MAPHSAIASPLHTHPAALFPADARWRLCVCSLGCKTHCPSTRAPLCCLKCGSPRSPTVSCIKHWLQKNPRAALNELVRPRIIHISTVSELLAASTDALRIVCTDDALRRQHLFDGRPIVLSDSSLLAIEIIASHGRQGVTQAELARLMGCDSRSAFHWLQTLVAHDLIVRVPVTANKTFTYLLTLTCFVDEELGMRDDATDLDLSTAVSTVDIRQMIVDILAKAPDQTMVSMDIFAATGLAPSQVKAFRRAALKLNEMGWLEYPYEEQLAGPYCRLYRLKTPAHPATLDVKTAIDSQRRQSSVPESAEDMEWMRLARGADFRTDRPVIMQIVLLVARAFPRGITTSELCHRLGFDRKYVYRLIERLVPSGKRTFVLGAEGICKVAEFVGKEKRLRLFVRDAHWQAVYLSYADTALFAGATPSEDCPPSTSSVPSHISAAPAAASPLPLGTDTITRQDRNRAILAELDQHPILEIGKNLAQRVQQRIGDSRFLLDVKTLRRSIDLLESEGRLRTVVTLVPYGTGSMTRVLAVHRDIASDSPRVGEYIHQMQEAFRSGRPPGADTRGRTTVSQRLREAMSQGDNLVPIGDSVETSTEDLSPRAISVRNRSALAQFGFVFGILARAQKLHVHLASNVQEDADKGPFFDTIPVIFERLPLGLYLEIIGVTRMSRQLHLQLPSLRSSALQTLPEDARNELALGRKRLQSQAALLLQTLAQLGLIVGEEKFAALNFRLPFRFRLSPAAPLYCPSTGTVIKTIPLGRHAPEDTALFWSELRALSNPVTHISSIYDSDVSSSPPSATVPHAFLLAQHQEAWQSRPDLRRELERAVQRLAVKLVSAEKSKRRRLNTLAPHAVLDEQHIDEAISEIVTKYDTTLERVQNMLLFFGRRLEERTEAKRLATLSNRKSNSDDSEDSDGVDGVDAGADADADVDGPGTENDDESDGSETEIRSRGPQDWSVTDQKRLLVAFCILKSAPFCTDSGIKWNLAWRVFERLHSSISIRRHGLGICRSYEVLQRLLELDTIVQLVLAHTPLPPHVTVSPEAFRELFLVCQEAIESPVRLAALLDATVRFDDEQSDAVAVRLPDRTASYLQTVNNWIVPRSFRHEQMLNDSGLVVSRDTQNEGEGEDVSVAALSPSVFACVRALRRVLLEAAGSESSFDATMASALLHAHGGDDLATLKEATHFLMSCGFAARTKGRNRYRLLGFLLALSESARNALVAPDAEDAGSDADVDFGTFNPTRWRDISARITTVSNATRANALHHRGLEGVSDLVAGAIAESVSFVPLNLQDSLRPGCFDIKLSVVSQDSVAGRVEDSDGVVTGIRQHLSGEEDGMSRIRQHLSEGDGGFIWFKMDGSLNETVALCALRHLERLTRRHVGCSLRQLQKHAWPVLTDDEVSILIECLVQLDIIVKQSEITERDAVHPATIFLLPK